MSEDTHAVLTAVGPRLRALRKQRGTTLEQLAESTGISVSTLSRLESGHRRPTLELLLPLARRPGRRVRHPVPHGFANVGREPLELLLIFGPQGERARTATARPAPAI